MFRPAPRALWFGVWLTLASLAVAALQPQLWWVIAGGWLVLVLAMLLDALRALPGGRLRMDVSAPPVLYIGEDDPLVLRFSAQGRGQATFLRAAPDVTGPIEDLPTLSTGFDPSDTVAAALEYRIRPTARGTVQLPAVHLGWAGPWLLVERRRVIRTDWEVAVIPNVRAVQREAVQLRKLAEDFGAKVQRIVGSGSEFEALMEFQAGHETRHIDWKHSARHRKLLVKDMQVERNHQIILAHDTGYLMREPIDGVPKLDHAINAALKLAWLGLSTDTITAALLMENVAALTRKHLVVFAVPKDPFADRILDQHPEGLVDATRAVVAETFANERRVVFDRLRRLGVEVLEVPPKGFSAALLNTYLSVKERSLL